MKENFKIAISNDPFRRLLLSGILRSPIMLLSIVGLSLVMYYFFDNNLANLVVDGQLQIIKIVQLLVMAIGLLGGMIIGTAATPKMSAKFGKKQLYNFYSIAGAVPYAMIFVVYKIAGGNLMQNMVYVVLMAVMMFAASWAMGSINILQSIMIADCVDYEEYKNGVRTDGVFFSGQSFITHSFHNLRCLSLRHRRQQSPGSLRIKHHILPPEHRLAFHTSFFSKLPIPVSPTRDQAHRSKLLHIRKHRQHHEKHHIQHDLMLYARMTADGLLILAQSDTPLPAGS